MQKVRDSSCVDGRIADQLFPPSQPTVLIQCKRNYHHWFLMRKDMVRFLCGQWVTRLVGGSLCSDGI